jgi:hypothetical protein
MRLIHDPLNYSFSIYIICFKVKKFEFCYYNVFIYSVVKKIALQL